MLNFSLEKKATLGEMMLNVSVQQQNTRFRVIKCNEIYSYVLFENTNPFIKRHANKKRNAFQTRNPIWQEKFVLNLDDPFQVTLFIGYFPEKQCEQHAETEEKT
jgi:hypothetical protein